MVAQTLAHEAVHLLRGRGFILSIDEEYLCFKKEAEVWAAIKGNIRDAECDEAQALIDRGEAAARKRLRELLPPDTPEQPRRR